jgi:hypothetical protein
VSAEEIIAQFVFPGEGAIIFGRLVTDDTPLVSADELDSIPNWGKNRERPEW